MTPVKIQHVALWSKDIEKLRRFYVQYFGAGSGTKYVNTAKKFSSYFLLFDSGARLEIMQSEYVSDTKDPVGRSIVGIAHIAFSVGSKENVDQLTALLKKDRFEILDGPRTTGDGCYESVVLDPDGNRLEITI